MPQGNSAVRPTNGLYLFTFTTLRRVKSQKNADLNLIYFNTAVKNLVVLTYTTNEIMNTTKLWEEIETFVLIKATDALISQIYFIKKLYMLRAVPLLIIRSIPLYIRHWYMSCSFDDSFQARLSLYTSAECTVENS